VVVVAYNPSARGSIHYQRPLIDALCTLTKLWKISVEINLINIHQKISFFMAM